MDAGEPSRMMLSEELAKPEYEELWSTIVSKHGLQQQVAVRVDARAEACHRLDRWRRGDWAVPRVKIFVDGVARRRLNDGTVAGDERGSGRERGDAERGGTLGATEGRGFRVQGIFIRPRREHHLVFPSLLVLVL